MARKLPAVLLLMATLALAKFPPEEYRVRRENLRKSVDGVLVLFARTEGRDEVFRAPPDANFYYLTGWSEPGARLLMTPTQEILFLPRHNERLERYQGRRWSAEDAGVRSVTGFEQVLPIEKFEAELDKALEAHENLYAALNQPSTQGLETRYPFREVADATPLIAKLRMKKSPSEIAAIQHATDVSLQAHRDGMEAHRRRAIRISDRRHLCSTHFWRRGARARRIRPSSDRGRTALCCITWRTGGAWIAASWW